MPFDVVLIDDEAPALMELQYLLGEYPEITPLGTWTDPVAALTQIKKVQPAAVFLDINMPQIGGLSAAQIILKESPETRVIFVTAYEQYALDAFRVEAFDYLLKPIQKDQLARTVARLKRKAGLRQPEETKTLSICCMGSLQMCWKGSAPIKWRTEKERELFAFLLHHRGQEIPRDRIIDCLWKEQEADRSIHHLHNCIYYLKKTLREYGIGTQLLEITKRYCLQLKQAELDVSLLEDMLRNASALNTAESLENALQLLKDGYLEFDGWTWAEYEREEWNCFKLDLLVRLTQHYIGTKQFQNAELILRRSYAMDPFIERVTHLLMELYQETGQIKKAAKHYLNYCELLQVELGETPSKQITEIYRSLQR